MLQAAFIGLLFIGFIIYIFRAVREDDRLHEEITNFTRNYYDTEH